MSTKPQKVRESTVEAAICQYAKDNGITVLKLNGPGERGKSDRLFMKDGRVAFLEVKATGEKPTALQLRFLRQRRADRFAADWTDKVDLGVFFLFNNLRRSPQLHPLHLHAEL
jgi:Holliday junction resolvase-like predicted endonuclease